MPSFDIAGRGKRFIILLSVLAAEISSSCDALLSMLTAITLTQFMLKLLVNAKIVESPSAYGADGFVLFDVAADGKAVKK